MDARERARMVVAHTVLRLLRRKDFRAITEGTNSAGEHVILPALPDDRMGYFFDQMRTADGPVYIAMLEDNGVAIISLAPRREPKHAVPADDYSCPIHRNTELVMVLDYLRATRGPITCHEAAPTILMELVDDTQVQALCN